jgi:PPM family protein phosphatase
VLVAYGITDTGHVRPTNEDCFAILEQLGFCVIADGMGGHNAGEVASRLVVDTVVQVVQQRSATASAERSRSLEGPSLPAVDNALHPFGLDPALSKEGNLLRTAILLANAQVLEAATTAEQYAGMGTTVVATLAVDGRLTVASVGDSRLYLYAGNRLRQLTSDDSWVATVLASDPEADPLLLQHHPMRNALTNVVGARSHTEVHVVEEPLAAGDRLLLTTDGVHGVVADEQIERMMREDDDPRKLADRILAAALTRGSRDNCTVIVARYE